MAWVIACDGCRLPFAASALVDGECEGCRAAAAAPAEVEVPAASAALEAARVEIDLVTGERDDLREAIAALITPPEPGPEIEVTYRNYRGEVARRTIRPRRIWHGSTDWHPEAGWLLDAFDVQKGEDRSFALKDCEFAALSPAAPPPELMQERDRLRERVEKLEADLALSMEANERLAREAAEDGAAADRAERALRDAEAEREAERTSLSAELMRLKSALREAEAQRDHFRAELRTAVEDRAQMREQLADALHDAAADAEAAAAPQPAPAKAPEGVQAHQAASPAIPARKKSAVMKKGAASRFPEAILDQIWAMHARGSKPAEIAGVLGLNPAKVGAALAELEREAAA